MPIKDLLLPEFDAELRKTRIVLERIPDTLDKHDFKPHEKSASLAKLAAHTAQMPGMLSIILGTPDFDFAKSTHKPLVMQSRAQLLAAFDKLSAEAHALLEDTTDRAMHETWKLTYNGNAVYDGSRYYAVRTMFFNHVIHHRAQLGVYLRLNDIPVPATYGPSSDES
ncbi:MAG TPA: DinB family protein [Edaphobacter sp.]|jgi:uncharacterized damage-inducible protein DinB|nr:DinB family protein [Edaphobacter sp.]